MAYVMLGSDPMGTTFTKTRVVGKTSRKASQRKSWAPPQCYVCGGNTVMLYVDLGIEHRNSAGETVAMFCLPCSRNVNEWDQSTHYLMDTVR